MYVAGTSTILVLWGVIASLGIMSQYAIETFAAEFMSRNPWTIAPLWGMLMVLGMAGSAIIENRAGRKAAAGEAIRTAGIRMFFFWLAVVAAAFYIPSYLAGDAAPMVTAVAFLVVAALSAAWIRKSGVL